MVAILSWWDEEHRESNKIREWVAAIALGTNTNTNASLKRFLISCAVDKNALKTKRANRSEPKQITQKLKMKKKWRSSEKDEAVSRRVGEQEMNWQKDSHAAKDQDRHWSRLQQRHRLMVCTWSVHKTKSSHKLIIWEFINLKRRRGIMGLRLQADATRRDDRQINGIVQIGRPIDRAAFELADRKRWCC